jgi:hypothetical protein
MNDQRRLNLRAAVPYKLQRACDGKTRFPSKKNATARARVLNKGYSAYCCPNCHHWHIGHSTPWRPWIKRPPRKQPEVNRAWEPGAPQC